jgi:hypothetical protein
MEIRRKASAARRSYQLAGAGKAVGKRQHLDDLLLSSITGIDQASVDPAT